MILVVRWGLRWGVFLKIGNFPFNNRDNWSKFDAKNSKMKKRFTKNPSKFK